MCNALSSFSFPPRSTIATPAPTSASVTHQEPPRPAAAEVMPGRPPGMVEGMVAPAPAGRRTGVDVGVVEAGARDPGLAVPVRAPVCTPTPAASPDDAGVGSYDVHPDEGPRYTSGHTWASAPVTRYRP